MKKLHIAIIPDGNRRWARERGLSAMRGHEEGYKTMVNLIEWCSELKEEIAHVTIFGFSTENWKRNKKEIDSLMSIFIRALRDNAKRMVKEGGRLRVIGERDMLPLKLVREIESAEHLTKDSSEATVTIALSYGGKSDIVNAANRALEKGSDRITENDITANLSTSDIPDPDIVIRLGAEKRISNFLLWQMAYSELFFLKKYWPDFRKEDLLRILDQYRGRDRRFGGE